MNKIKNTANRLVMLSELIISTIDDLSELSYNNQELEDIFLKYVNDLKLYLEREEKLINTLDIDTLNKTLNYLAKNDDQSDSYNRAIIRITDTINELDNELDQEENSNNIDEENDQEFDGISEFDDLSDYVEDDTEYRNYINEAIDYIATIAIKKMESRIKNTIADNKGDIKYKKRLLKYFKQFKYYYFTLDYKLELKGVDCLFNVDNLKISKAPNIDTSVIYNNDTVMLINNLYSMNNTEYRLDEISKALFEMITLEEYINYLDNERINNLIDLCDKLDSKNTNSFYGNIAKNKLLTRKRDFN